MVQAADCLSAFRSAGFEIFSGVPCSYLTPLINAVISSPDIDYIAAANEGDAVSIASGGELAGKRGVALFQNSGLGNAVNPLTSLNHTLRIPILVITTWRGDPAGAPDEPQHDLMGAITPELLELMRIPHELFPSSAADLQAALGRATAHMDAHGTPYALIVKKGTVEASGKLEDRVDGPARFPAREAATAFAERFDPDRTLATIQRALRPSDAVVATTGFTGRALYAQDDRPNQLYMVGSMGCASSLGLGLARALPERRIVVLDGDGACLMRLGALTTIGREAQTNLIHVLLDNEVHDSTGAQATVSPVVDLAGVAAATGYPRAERVASLEELEQALSNASSGPLFLQVPTLPRADRKLPRPSQKPPEVAQRFRAFLRGADGGAG